MQREYIKFEVMDGVGTITLNRPEKRNAFTQDMADAWSRQLLEAENDAQVKVIVVTGAGKAFCAGGDMEEMRDALGRPSIEFKNFLHYHVHRVAFALDRMEKPVICALNGTARGAGLDMALMCDLRYAAESATLAESYVKIGLVTGNGGTYFLPRLIGTSRALEMLWTGREVTASEAERMGLVNRVIPDAELMSAVMELAKEIASQPQDVIRYFKRAVYQGAHMSLAGHLDMMSSHMAVLQGTEAHHERVHAFFEAQDSRKRRH